MRLLYVAQRHDYGEPSRGEGFEYHAFFKTFQRLGVELIEFDYPSVVREFGTATASRRLAEIAKSEQPDVLFAVLRSPVLDRRVVRDISEQTSTTTVNWYCDDHWQFATASRHWTPAFNHVATTAASALPRYMQRGWNHVLLSQWAVDERVFRPTRGEPECDVSFVGQPYGDRAPMIEALRRAGVSVATFGRGWPEGRVDQRRMVELFGHSKVSLNFTRASHAEPTFVQRIRNRPGFERLAHSPGVWRLDSMLRRFDSPSLTPQRPRQIKGRVFEVPACRGVLLTETADDLDTFYVPDQEIAVFGGTDDLIERCRTLLRDDDLRHRMAEASYRRTLREHTWPVRLGQLFDAIGKPLPQRPLREAA